MLNTPFQLPCGVTLPNRLVKAAMTERLTRADGLPHQQHFHLYEQWAATNAGLLITGNVMTEPQHMESCGNVVIADRTGLPKLQKWAEIAKNHGNHVWVQISHSGRQTSRFINRRPKAPSQVQLKRLGLFGKPQALQETEIYAIIEGFARTAAIVKEAGFTGVQIHAAHGYLLSQFLSPRTNRRTDQWGGSLENRSRLLRNIILQVREAVGAGFPISVKLNSADFQRGGFSEEESIEVVRMLDTLGVDLLEISGGTYENVAFFLLNEKKQPAKESTQQREAYFMDFARQVREVSQLPLMVTGGFRTYDFCEEVLQKGELDLIGMARPFITNLDEMAGFLTGAVNELYNQPIRTGIQLLEDAAEGGYYARQIVRIAKGQAVKLKHNALLSALYLVKHEFTKAAGKGFGLFK